MRCYMSKQLIARLCVLGAVMFLMLTLLPFPHKDRERALKTSKARPESLRSSYTSTKSEKKDTKTVEFDADFRSTPNKVNTKPVETVVKVKASDTKQKPDNKDTVKPSETKQSNTKPEEILKAKKEESEKKDKDNTKKSGETKVLESKQKEASDIPKLKEHVGKENKKADVVTNKENVPKKVLDTDKQDKTNTGTQLQTKDITPVDDKKQVNSVKDTKPIEKKDTPSTSDQKPPMRKVQSLSNDKGPAKEMQQPKAKDEPNKIMAPTKVDQTKQTNTPITDYQVKPASQKDIREETRLVDSQKPKSVVTKMDNIKIEPVTIPAISKLKKMTMEQLEDLFFLYLENLQTHCTRQRHIGNKVSGGYHICEDVMNNEPCLVYSFGSPFDLDFSFEKALVSQYGCEVFAFGRIPSAKDRLSKVTFINETELSFYNERPIRSNLEKMTLEKTKTYLGHEQRPLKILQLDIDAQEWTVLDQICNGTELRSTSLLLVEFHLCAGDCMDITETTSQLYVRYLSLLKRLYDLGFRIYFFKMWSSCNFNRFEKAYVGCHDIHMVKLP